MANEGSAQYPGIRITAVDTFLVAGNCCFVKISTNEGITGLGEGSISDNKVGTIAHCIKDLEGHLIGKNPTEHRASLAGALPLESLARGRALQHRPQRHRYRPVGHPRKDRGPADLQAPRRRRAGQGPHLRPPAAARRGVQRARSMGCNAVKTGPPVTKVGDPLTVPMPWDLNRAGRADRGDAGRRGR